MRQLAIMVCWIAAACAASGQVTLTGDVEHDFTSAEALVVADPGGERDVGKPRALATTPGWELKDVRFQYDPVADDLYVGVNFVGIGGDADGDGNLADHDIPSGGRDHADLGESESVCVRFDFDRDGVFDLIAGVGAHTNIAGLAVAHSLNHAPPDLGDDFGAVFADWPIRTPGAPTADKPDFEFVIGNFSELGDCATADFNVEAFAGSFDDGGIGEDWLAGTAWGLGIVPVADAAGTGVSFRVWAPHATNVAVLGLDAARPDVGKNLFRESRGTTWGSFVEADAGTQLVKYAISTADGSVRTRKDPRSRDVTASWGRSLFYDPRAYVWDEGSNYLDSWNKLVLYEMHAGSFFTNAAASGYAFDQALAKLDYLVDLGINAIELLPLHEFPGDSSAGYDPTDFFAIARQYGGPDAFKRFVAACHRRNIAVLVDVVYNHVGTRDNELWQYDGWQENGKGGIYFYQDNRAHSGFGDRLDYDRPEVRAFINDNLLMYLCEYHVDGFRWDSTVGIRRTAHDGFDIPAGGDVLREGNRLIHAHNPHAISIAEDNQGWDKLTDRSNADGFGFDSQWSSGFFWALRRALTTSSDPERNMGDVANQIRTIDHGDAFSRVIFTENHDQVWIMNGNRRMPNDIDDANPFSYWARKRSTLGATLVMTAPGIPLLFMGQEFYSTGSWRDAVPLDWLLNDTQKRLAQLYKDLIHLRRNSNGTTAGLIGHHVNVHHVDDSGKVIAFHRWDRGGPGDDVVVVANFANATRHGYRIGLPKGGTWMVRFNSDAHAYAPDYSDVGGRRYDAEETAWDGLSYSAAMDLGPYSALILSQDRVDKNTGPSPVSATSPPVAPAGLKILP